MAPLSGTRVIKYKNPNPFVLPTVHVREPATSGGIPAIASQIPFKLIPREALEFAADILEEIMFQITAEFILREFARPAWRRYKSEGGNIGFDEFNRPDVNGGNLTGMPTEFFPLVVRDIQDNIDVLVQDSKFPDSRAQMFTRIFANKNLTNFNKWTSLNKLPESVTVNTRNGKTTISPLERAQAGDWVFEAEEIADIVAAIGVSTTKPRTVQNIQISTPTLSDDFEGKLHVSDPNFPQSPYGDDSATGEVPGTGNTEMTSDNLTVWDRKNEEDDPHFGIGEGEVDPDMGYGHYTSIGHMVEQLRYQPPQVENFPFSVAAQDYASNLFSNTTPNLPWVLSLPVERQYFQNWGFWLVKGLAGFSNNVNLKAYNNPSASAGARAVCPFSVFYPPSTAQCGCNTGDSAYAIWNAFDNGFLWNSIPLIQGKRAERKAFGKNTRLIATGGASGGASGDLTQVFFGIGIRTNRVGVVNFQPFHYIISNNISVGSGGPIGIPGNTGLDVNIMDNMQTIRPSYNKSGVDFLEAIQILIQTSSTSSWVCDAEDGATGTFLPDSCNNLGFCSAGSASAAISSLQLFEPPIIGDPVNNYR